MSSASLAAAIGSSLFPVCWRSRRQTTTAENGAYRRTTLKTIQMIGDEEAEPNCFDSQLLEPLRGQGRLFHHI